MTRVLLIGIHPDAVDITDPSLPPGITHEKIAAGIEQTMADMRSRGWEAGFCSLRPETAQADVVASLASAWDCIVIGGGIRIPPPNLMLFEMILNTIIRRAPGTPVAFNTSPENSADAAARWLR
jgi:phosphoglycolate phosphatase-like HAD superfamily hydrolase